ncbi:MAG: hypothetical protein JWO06_440 [Bacteroidota bacterium]|nr:hypothetical protein [Bacteroidota bacterium]
MKEYKFKAILQGEDGGGVYVPFPYDAKKEFGKGKIPIKCTIDGEHYRGTMIKYGTPFHIIVVLKAIREKIKKGAGDTVSVWLVEDKEERKVEVPADLEKLLKKNKLSAVFDKMSFTHKKEWVLWINDAKKEETRLRRMEKVIEKLKGKG